MTRSPLWFHAHLSLNTCHLRLLHSVSLRHLLSFLRLSYVILFDSFLLRITHRSGPYCSAPTSPPDSLLLIADSHTSARAPLTHSCLSADGLTTHTRQSLISYVTVISCTFYYVPCLTHTLRLSLFAHCQSIYHVISVLFPVYLAYTSGNIKPHWSHV